MIDRVPYDLIYIIIDFLDYKDILSLLQSQKKLYYDDRWKKNIIWKKFFVNKKIKLEEYTFYNVLKNIRLNSLVCIKCSKKINSKYILVLCPCYNYIINDPNLEDIYLHYHKDCIIKKENETKKKYNNIDCPICNSLSICLECNIYS